MKRSSPCAVRLLPFLFFVSLSLVASTGVGLCGGEEGLSNPSGTSSSEFATLVYHNISSTYGTVGYISVEYLRPIRPSLYSYYQILFGRGRMSRSLDGVVVETSTDTVVGVGVGLKRYLGSTGPQGLWYGGSFSASRIASNSVEWGVPRFSTELSGLLIANAGYTLSFNDQFTAEIIAGMSFPSLYLRPGVTDDLYASPFFGVGVSFPV